MAKKYLNYCFQNQLMDFGVFLNSGDCVTVNNGSPQSYKSYIKALNKYFGNIEKLKFKGGNIFDALPSIVAQDMKKETSYASTILTLLYHVPYPDKEIAGFSKKYWQNCRSALKQFIDYNSSDIYQSKCVGVTPCTKNDVDNYVKMLQSIATKQVYDYNMLFAVFLSRIRTQDRYPVGGRYYLPIRILSKLFNKSNHKGNWNDLLKKYIDGIKFYYDEGKTGENIKNCILKDINHLYIDNDKKVWITIKGIKGRKRLYTQTAAGIIGKMQSVSTLPPYVLQFMLRTPISKSSSLRLYKPQVANSLRDINIQHDTPISVYLKNVHGSEVPTLSDLCGFIRRFCEEQGIELLQKNASEISANFDLPRNMGNREKFIADLFDDIKKIFDLHPLSIMDEHENKSLNDKDVPHGVIKVDYYGPFNSFGQIHQYVQHIEFDYGSQKLVCTPPISDVKKRDEIIDFLNDYSSILTFFNQIQKDDVYAASHSAIETIVIEYNGRKKKLLQSILRPVYNHPF